MGLFRRPPARTNPQPLSDRLGAGSSPSLCAQRLNVSFHTWFQRFVTSCENRFERTVQAAAHFVPNVQACTLYITEIVGPRTKSFSRHSVSLAFGRCPLWVKSRHSRRNKARPLYPQQRPRKRILAKGHVRFTLKADMCVALTYVCFGPKVRTFLNS